MKAPEIKWVDVYIVQDWATEIQKGIGFEVTISDKFTSYDYYLVKFENSTTKTEKFELSQIYKSNIYLDYNSAIKRLQSEKEKYLKFCKEQLAEYKQKIEKINNKQ